MMRIHFQVLIVLAGCCLSPGVFKAGMAGDGLAGLFGRKPEKSVEWLVSESAVVEATRKTDRPIIIYATSSNCTFCRKMERETWSNPKVIAAIEAGFIPLRVTPDSHPELVERLNVQGFPTTFIISPRGSASPRIEGYVSHDRLLPVLDEVRQSQLASREGSSTEARE